MAAGLLSASRRPANMQNATTAADYRTGRKSRPPAWVAYGLTGLLCLSASLATGLAPYFSPPVAGQPAGIVFFPFSDGMDNMARLLDADPGLAIVDSWYSERVIFVVPSDPDFFRKLTGIGAIHAFDAIAAGCHV